MAFRERTAWITLVTTVLVYSGYFAVAAHRLGPQAPALGLVGPLAASILAIVVLQVALTAVTAMASPKDAVAPIDERERLIQLHATRAGFFTLQVGAFFAITTLFWGADAKLIANGVFLAIVVAEVVRSGWQVAAYRRGTA